MVLETPGDLGLQLRSSFGECTDIAELLEIGEPKIEEWVGEGTENRKLININSLNYSSYIAVSYMRPKSNPKIFNLCIKSF